MKRFDPSDSLHNLLSISRRPQELMSSRDLRGYSEEFQAMLDNLVEEDALLEETLGNTSEKKRRLTVDQVKALEKNFAAENKLEPERKVRIAEELGLQPRQVAIWFQNRRARWKTKQLEKDYGVLKAKYDALMLDYNNLEQERQVLTLKLEELRAKYREENKEEEEDEEEEGNKSPKEQRGEDKLQIPIISHSSSYCLAYLNGSYSTSSSRSTAEDCRFSGDYPAKMMEIQTVKLEEQCGFLNAEEPCNFFSVDHAPTLQWCLDRQ